VSDFRFLTILVWLSSDPKVLVVAAMQSIFPSQIKGAPQEKCNNNQGTERWLQEL